MNKFEKVQEILKELNGDGWLIISSEDSDINSRFLLGVESHARHYIFVGANGDHRVLAVTMEAAMIEKHKDILTALSSKETLAEGQSLLSQQSEEDQKWIMGMLETAGTIMPVEQKNGDKSAIAIMNGMETKKLFKKDGNTPRSPEELEEYDEDYKRNENHEARHVLYYKKYGKN